MTQQASTMATGGKSQYKGSDDGDLDCDVCLVDGITSPAISYCKLCTETLCLACEKVHKASKRTRGHALLTGDQLFSIPRGDRTAPSIMTCEKHEMTVKYFCKEDDTVICGSCQKTSHETCDYVEIRKHLTENDHSKAFDMIQNKMAALEKSYEQLQKRRESGKNILKIQVQSCLAEMKTVRKEVNRLLDDLESKMVAEIDKAEDEISKEIEDHLSTADATLRKIRENLATMTECDTTGQADVMFVGMKKTQGNIPEYEKLLSALDYELGEIDIQFVPDDLFTTQIQNLKSLGRLDRREKGQQENAFSALELTLTDPTRHDVGFTDVYSIVFLQDHVVLGCGNDGLKLLNANFEYQSNLPMKAFQACKTSETELLVSQRDGKQLQFVDITSQMVAMDVIRIGMYCMGVDYHNDEIYVVCRDGQCKLEVRVLNRNGDVIRPMGGDLGKSIHILCDVKVNSRGDKLFVSNTGTSTVTCLDQQGGVIYKYSDTDMKRPTGMYVDGHDNLLLCGNYSNNVHVITADGRKHACVGTRNDRIIYPYCISYRPHDGCLVIGCGSPNNNKSLVSFKTRFA